MTGDCDDLTSHRQARPMLDQITLSRCAADRAIWNLFAPVRLMTRVLCAAAHGARIAHREVLSTVRESQDV